MMGNDKEYQVKQKGAKEIDLKEIFNIIKRQLWVVISLTVLMAGFGVWYSKHHKPVPMYQSSTRLLINSGNSTDMSTLMVMFTDPAVLTKLSQQIGLSRSPSQLSNEISVSSLNNSQIVNLQVTDQNAYEAAEIANKEAIVFKDEVASVLNFNGITQLSAANVNPVPINQGSSHKKEIYATLAGLVLGIFWCFFRNSFDDTIRNEKELESLLLLPVMGSVPKMTKKNSRKYKSKRLRVIELLNKLFTKNKSVQTHHPDQTNNEKLNEKSELMENRTAASQKKWAKVNHDN